MQEKDGSMRKITDEELKTHADILNHPKALGIGNYFKIKRCYFKITKFAPEGIEAKGVSRREYFDNR